LLCAHNRCRGQSTVFITSTAKLVLGTDLTESSKCSKLEKQQKFGFLINKLKDKIGPKLEHKYTRNDLKGCL